MISRPLLYNFRRCPFAIRARMALSVSTVEYDRVEVALRRKPEALLAASPKGTVPILVLPGGRVIDESLDIMRWALAQNDPEDWLEIDHADEALIADTDGGFKFHLDRMKYTNRFPGEDASHHRDAATAHLSRIDQRLGGAAYLGGDAPRFADVAIFPFIRQFAAAEPAWFAALPLAGLLRWHAAMIAAPRFVSVIAKPG